MIYLDNAATTEISENVLHKIRRFQSVAYGNPSSIYPMGRYCNFRISYARTIISTKINSSPKDDIVFTSGGSESDTLAIIGLSDYLKKCGKTHIITSAVEHKAVLRSFEYLGKNGFDVDILPVTQYGTVEPDVLKSAIKDNTGLISIMYVNNELGSVNDIKTLCSIAHEHNIVFHTDAVQAISQIKIDVEDLGIDMLSVSGHKIHAPKGVGFLYVRNGVELRPIIFGGQQEKGLRGGTENIDAIVGLERAICDLDYSNDKYKELSNAFVNELNDWRRNDFKFRVNNPQSHKIISLCIKGVDAQTLVVALGQKGICVSAGSACNSQSTEPSHVLIAAGLSPDEALSTIRISFGDKNTISEAKIAARTICEVVNQLMLGL